MTAVAAEIGTKTHLSLNVVDLAKSIAFYRVLFGTEPAKRHDDYAKFELAEPPVVLSLQPGPRRSGASLSHLGLRFPNADGVLAVQKRLEAAAIPTRRQDGVICGYARQSKCWATDPDGNFWEVYVLEADVDPSSVGACLSELAPSAGPITADAPTSTWDHSLSDPVPARLSHADNTLDEVRLEGTWNAPLLDEDRQQLLTEVFRTLKPSGKVAVRGLFGDRAFSADPPQLPGPASVVGRVPPQDEPVQELKRAGFVGIHVAKLAEAPYLTLGGVEMRQMRLSAVKPLPAGGSRKRMVMYKGPLAQVADADGTTFARGVRVEVADRTWEALLAGPAAGQFLFANPGTAPACNAR